MNVTSMCPESLSREYTIPANSFSFLTAPQTCKRVNEASGEHQAWLNQVRRLQIPLPAGTVPPAAELKEWAISWLRSDERWIRPRTTNGDDGDRLLNPPSSVLQKVSQNSAPFGSG